MRNSADEYVQVHGYVPEGGRDVVTYNCHFHRNMSMTSGSTLLTEYRATREKANIPSRKISSITAGRVYMCICAHSLRYRRYSKTPSWYRIGMHSCVCGPEELSEHFAIEVQVAR